MKKILTIIAIFVSVALNAQTIENPKMFENVSVTAYGGLITTSHFGGKPMFWDGLSNVVNGICSFSGVEVTKYVTPKLGFGLECLAMLGTTGSNSFIDQTNLVGNAKFNLANIFYEYNGMPKNVEVVLVPGIGLGHDYGDVYHDRNYLTYNFGTEVNFNLGNKKEWQLNLKPVVMYNNYNNVLTPLKKNLQLRFQVGITYKFYSQEKKSHNFVLCPYTVTAEEYQAVKKEIKELESREPIVDTVVVEKEIVVEKEKEVFKEVEVSTTVIYFDKGRYNISERELSHLDFFAQNADKNVPIKICGSADSATGNKERNNYLALRRAFEVRDTLVNVYGFDKEKITIDAVADLFETPERSRSVFIE